MVEEITEDPDAVDETFLVERYQGDLVVERTVTAGLDYEILEDFQERYPSDDFKIFPCTIDDGFSFENDVLPDGTEE